jgi:4-hydroxybenzoate polyprenyltransferase
MRGQSHSRDRWPGPMQAYLEMLHLPPIGAVLAAAGGFSFAAAGGGPPLDRLGLYLTALLLTQLSLSVHNDYCDRALDAVSKPWRPLPRGLVRPATARLWAVGLLGAGLGVASLLGWEVAALVALGTGAGLIYNAYLKTTYFSWLPFLFAVPTLAVCSFAVVGRLESRLLLLYAVGAPFALAIHLIDTLGDAEADAAAGLRSPTAWLGHRGTLLACWGTTALALLVIFALWPAGGSPGLWFFVALVLFGTALLAARLGAWRLHWFGVVASLVVGAVDWLVVFAA